MSDTEEELASLEHVDHDGNMLLDLLKCLLGVLGLILVVCDLREQHVHLVLQRLLEVELTHVGQLTSLDNLLDLVLDLLVGLFKLIELSVQHVHIVL